MRIFEILKEDFKDEFDVDAYHGTTKDFDAFDPNLTGDIGMHFGNKKQAHHFTLDYMGRDKEGANIIPVKLRLKNPLRVKDMFSTLRTTYINRAKQFTLNTKGFYASDADRKEIYDAAKEADLARRKAGGEWGMLDKSKAEAQNKLKIASKRFWKAIENSAIHQGYDGFVYDNKAEGKGDSYVVFDPKNIRVKHASFDPKKANSDKLLDSEQFP